MPYEPSLIRQVEPTFTCCKCHEIKPVQPTGGTGYATNRDNDDKTCYACCAIADRAYMDSHDRITLYLIVDHESLAVNDVSHEHNVRNKICPRNYGWKVTNWPGSLVLHPFRVREGRHNIAGKRYDCWFNDHKNRKWHGVQYGDNTQIVHCRKLKTA